MSLRRVFLIFGIFLAVLFLHSPHKAYAHYPETEGNLTAILHVEPDDSPPAGKPETIYFIFNDLSNHFKLTNCNCNLSISQKNQVQYYGQLSSPPSGQATVYDTKGIPFTFPAAGAYQIALVGRPISGTSFQPFTLHWNFQVGKSSKPKESSSAQLFLSYFLLILGVLFFLGIMVYILA